MWEPRWMFEWNGSIDQKQYRGGFDASKITGRGDRIARVGMAQL
jgi:hypothetical protein